MDIVRINKISVTTTCINRLIDRWYGRLDGFLRIIITALWFLILLAAFRCFVVVVVVVVDVVLMLSILYPTNNNLSLQESLGTQNKVDQSINQSPKK
jgi:hypothetical protein